MIDGRQGTDGDWRVLDGAATAWFGAPTMSAGATLVGRIAALAPGEPLPDLDLRPDGVRVRIGRGEQPTRPDVERAGSVSAAARDLGLVADPSVLQVVRLAVDTADPSSLAPFWTSVLGYVPDGPDGLRDPSRRHPACSFHRSPSRPLRDRFHLDVVRAPEAVQAAGAAVGQEPSGAFGVALVDADGNVLDAVPGGGLAAGPETEDWQTLFAAVAHYPLDPAAPTGELAGDVASTVAGLADEAGLPLLVDVRPDGITVDGGKDRWEGADGSADPAFVDLAARIQAAVRHRGLRADPGRPCFVQVGLDAVDVAAVRAFWAAALGYRPDPREFVTDLYDPRRLGPVLFFQAMDAAETERRAQRNRVHLDLVLPPDQLATRTERALAAGGRIDAGSSVDRRIVLDPEGNELHLVTSGPAGGPRGDPGRPA